MPEYLYNIIVGIKTWIVGLFNSAIAQYDYYEEELYQPAIHAEGIVARAGNVVTLYVSAAQTWGGWWDIKYRLPYAPDAAYVNIVNDRGFYESHGIHYKVSFVMDDPLQPEPYLVLHHYVNGTQAAWESDQTVSFKVDYITSETFDPQSEPEVS